MFEDIFEMGVVRSRRQAIGFYLFFAISTIIAAMIAGALFGLWFGYIGALATNIGVTIAMVASLLLGFMVVKAKSIFNAQTVILVLLAGVLSFFGGVVLGLIPVAYLTTLPSKVSHQSIDDENDLSEVSSDNREIS